MNRCLTTAALCLVLSACGSVGDRPTVAAAGDYEACAPVRETRLEPAMEQASEALARGACSDQFEEYWIAILDAASRQPTPANKAVLAAFLSRQRDVGAITAEEARARYSRYFDARFYSLPDDFNTCAYANGRETLSAGLAEELRQKRRGLVDIADDKAAYGQSLALHRDLKRVLLAARTACVAG